MSLHNFSVGTRFRWDGKIYEIRPSSSGNTIIIRDVLTKEETSVEMQSLVKAHFRQELFFVERGSSTKAKMPSSSELEAAPPTLADYSAHQVNIAYYRLQVISPLLQLKSKERTRVAIGTYVDEIKAQQDPSLANSMLGTISKNSVYRWISLYLKSDNDIRSLIPKLGLRGGKNKARLDNEVDELIDLTIQELYKRPEDVSIDDVAQEIACKVQERNIAQPEKNPLLEPSRATVARRIENLGMAERFAIRYGKRLARQKFSQYGQNKYPDMPCERVEIDHTRADFIVIDDRDNLPLGRPTLTYCLDMATRYPLGYYIGFEPPSYLAVMECLYHAIGPKESVREKYGTEHEWLAYGIPSTLVIDNGREFIGRDLSDACLSLGIILQQTPVRTPHFKAGIERNFGTLNTGLFHTLPGTTFSHPQDRGDYDSLEQACVYLSDVEKLFNLYVVDVYAEDFHRGLEAVPARRWEEALQAGFLPTLPRVSNDLHVLLGRIEWRVVWHYGVDFESIRYNCDNLIEVRTKLKGEKVKIKYNPGDLSYVHVFNPLTKEYIKVPALDQEYTQGLSLWKHRIIRRNAALNEQGRVSQVALGQAKRKIREIIEAGRERKRVSTRVKIARWDLLENRCVKWT